MAELLTRQMAVEYRNRARCLPDNGRQDIGELQARCNITELAAVNIINGYHISDYVMLEERKEQERNRKVQEE